MRAVGRKPMVGAPRPLISYARGLLLFERSSSNPQTGTSRPKAARALGLTSPRYPRGVPLIERLGAPPLGERPVRPGPRVGGLSEVLLDERLEVHLGLGEGGGRVRGERGDRDALRDARTRPSAKTFPASKTRCGYSFLVLRPSTAMSEGRSESRRRLCSAVRGLSTSSLESGLLPKLP